MTLDAQALDQIFLKARTANGFTDEPVPEALLRQVYDIARMGPTSMNTQPTRYVFLNSPESRARLLPALTPGNLDKTRSAPVTVIVATDTKFHEFMPQVWHKEGARENFEANPALSEATATRNGTLGGAYFIIAARALGLDCGPMSGVDLAKVNAEFFPDGRLTANFLINLGYGDNSKLFPRNPRLSFEQACQLGLRGLVGFRLLQVFMQPGDLLLQRGELLARVVGQDEGTRFELGLAAKAAVEPDGDFACDLERLQAFAETDGVVYLVGGCVAPMAQQVKHLAYLRVQPEAAVHRAKQLGLCGLLQLDAEAVGHFLRQGLGQQPELEHSAGGIKREQPLGSGAQIGQQRRVFGKEAEIAAAHP